MPASVSVLADMKNDARTVNNLFDGVNDTFDDRYDPHSLFLSNLMNRFYGKCFLVSIIGSKIVKYRNAEVE